MVLTIELVNEYQEKFKEPPPIFGLPDAEGEKLIIEALDTGVPIHDPSDGLAKDVRI